MLQVPGWPVRPRAGSFPQLQSRIPSVGVKGASRCPNHVWGISASQKWCQAIIDSARYSLICCSFVVRYALAGWFPLSFLCPRPHKSRRLSAITPTHHEPYASATLPITSGQDPTPRVCPKTGQHAFGGSARCIVSEAAGLEMFFQLTHGSLGITTAKTARKLMVKYVRS